MPLSMQPYKGARDFFPEDKRNQKYLFRTMRQAVERFGYEEYDAPILEPVELYLAKSGEEIVNEQTYLFTDRGGNQVVIRPEMTPSVSRMVAARRQEHSYPLRWYSIPNLWRYERPQRGRLREHWQLNVDIFGIASQEAELEIIQIADSLLKAFNARPEMYSIRINSRSFMNFVLQDYLGLDNVEVHDLSKLIDRMNKIERTVFITQADAICSPSQREAGVVDKLLAVLEAPSVFDLPEALKNTEPVLRLQQLLASLETAGVKSAVFDPKIMRGFDYYTDIIFEVLDSDSENNRSMMGGGRYDGLVGLFGVEPVPSVGFAIGDVTLSNFLESHSLMPKLTTETDIYLVLAPGITPTMAQPTLRALRAMGINLALDSTNRKIGDQLKTADKKGIPYALIIGEAELQAQQFNLKHLQSGEEETHGLERIVSIVKDYRTSLHDSN